jgi:hypothetical protein
MKIGIKTTFERNDVSNPRYRVTPFKSTGIYPRGTFASNTGVFHADDEVVFAASYCSTWRAREDLPYSEVDWMNPELVRLLGSLMFCEQFSEGQRCWFYPEMYADLILTNEKLDLTQCATIAAIKEVVLTKPIFTSPSRPNLPSMGLISKGYLFDPEDELDLEMREIYWDSIQPSNFLVMRGIQALIKCDMLAMHHEFQEEAAILTFVALDASFELVKRFLRSTGISNPSSADAAKWFHQTFDGPMGFAQPSDANFFSDFYPQRVQTLHPGSRYGDSPFAAVAIDDRIHLRQALPGLFAFLLSGRHSPHYLKKFEYFQKTGQRL